MKGHGGSGDYQKFMSQYASDFQKYMQGWAEGTGGCGEAVVVHGLFEVRLSVVVSAAVSGNVRVVDTFCFFSRSCMLMPVLHH